jgi:hypothetical protein
MKCLPNELLITCRPSPSIRLHLLSFPNASEICGSSLLQQLSIPTEIEPYGFERPTWSARPARESGPLPKEGGSHISPLPVSSSVAESRSEDGDVRCPDALPQSIAGRV